jgi:hypothetical protein
MWAGRAHRGNLSMTREAEGALAVAPDYSDGVLMGGG